MKADSPRLVQEEKAESEGEVSEKTPVPDINPEKEFEEQSFGEEKGEHVLKS